MKEKLRLCYVVSSEMTVLAFLRKHITVVSQAGYEVSVVLDTSNRFFLRDLGVPGALYHAPISRTTAPWKDILALAALLRLFWTERFDIVHSVTPKAGLLGMFAAYVTATKCRLHTFTGQVWVTRSGYMRWVLRMCDRLLGVLATRLLADSESQMKFLIAEGIISSVKIEVIGNGSIAGVDCKRFSPDLKARKYIRRAIGIPLDAVVLIYLGRLNRDKGVLDLAEAFLALAAKHPDIYLLLVGPDEGDMSIELTRMLFVVRQSVRFIDFTSMPEKYYASADILCLPSRREGFGSTVIEAASVGIPCIASRIYGLTDAVVDNLTGFLYPAGDIEELSKYISLLVSDPLLRRRMGFQARKRASKEFSDEAVSKGLLAFYDRVVK